MAPTADEPIDRAVAYHARLAGEWEQRYRRPAFQSRLRVLGECLEGRELANQRWLDAGCGSGTLSRFLAGLGCRVLGVDASEEMIAAARRLAVGHAHADRLRFESVQCITRLSFTDRAFHGILCSSVLEYISDPQACLAEFSRILLPAGLLLVSVPNTCSTIRCAQLGAHKLGQTLGRNWLPFLNYSRHRLNPAAFGEMLSEFGFRTETMIPFGSPIPPWLQRLRFGGSLLMFCAVRRGHR